MRLQLAVRAASDSAECPERLRMMIAKIRRGTLVNYRQPSANYQLPTIDYRLTFRHDNAAEENHDGVCLRIRREKRSLGK